MIKSIKVEGFAGVPYLEGSSLMRRLGGKVALSTTKPNVVVGPNGSGKSALMTALSVLTLSHFTGRSELSEKYIHARESDAWWTKKNSWGHEFDWLKGLDVRGDVPPAVYYRPLHIPGNESDPTVAMLCGYFEEAKAYAAMTEEKSCGQKSRLLLEVVASVLRGESDARMNLKKGDWRYGVEKVDPRESIGNWDAGAKAEVLKEMFRRQPVDRSLVLMDEPERSLDSAAEMGVWKVIEGANLSRVQVIVATHSLYPLLNRKRFHLIESEEGYVDRVLEMVTG